MMLATISTRAASRIVRRVKVSVPIHVEANQSCHIRPGSSPVGSTNHGTLPEGPSLCEIRLSEPFQDLCETRNVSIVRCFVRSTLKPFPRPRLYALKAGDGQLPNQVKPVAMESQGECREGPISAQLAGLRPPPIITPTRDGEVQFRITCHYPASSPQMRER